MFTFRFSLILLFLFQIGRAGAQSPSNRLDVVQIEKYLQKSYQEYMEAINTDDRETEEKVMDDQDGKTFVETFYKSYAYTYIKMRPDLEQGLKHLRETYCTPIMQEKYVRSRKEVEQEDPMFDPVIGNDDFDVFWYNSLQVHPSETKGCFTVSYGCTKIRVALQCQDGKYKIADVELIP